MSNVLQHRFTSGKADGADATQVQPSHWNDGHRFIGGAAGQVLTRDPSDATFGAVWAPAAAAWASINSTVTGVVDNWAPAGFSTGHTVIFWNGAADVTITGLLAGAPGQTVTIKNVSTAHKVLGFAHAHANSAALNRFLNVITSGPTPIAFQGSAQFVYAGGWNLIAHTQGAPITPPFSAAYFGADAGAWTVPAGSLVMAHLITGASYQLHLGVNGSNLSGAATALFVALPGYSGANYLAGVTTRGGGQTINAGGNNFGLALATVNTGSLNVYSTVSAAPWTITAANNTSVFLNMAIPIL